MAKGQIKQKQATINQKTFEKLCELQCTEEEISAWFDVCEDTLCSWCKSTYNKNFSEVFQEKRKKGCVSLRRKQFQLAEKNSSMAIFLGKNYLGQKDVVETIDNSEVNTAIQNIAELLNNPKKPREEDLNE